MKALVLGPVWLLKEIAWRTVTLGNTARRITEVVMRQQIHTHSQLIVEKRRLPPHRCAPSKESQTLRTAQTILQLVSHRGGLLEDYYRTMILAIT